MLGSKARLILNHQVPLLLDSEVSPNDETPPVVVNGIFASLHVLLDNVANDTQLDYYSPEVVLQGVKWKIHIQRVDKYLGVFLEANNDDLDLSLSYTVDASFKLLIFSDPKTAIRNPINRQFLHHYRRGWSKHGFANFIEWYDFVHPKHDYVVRNKANFFIQFKAEQPKSVWDEDSTQTSLSKRSLACSLCNDEFLNGKIVSMPCGHLLCKHCRDSHIPTHICSICGKTSNTHQLFPVVFEEKKGKLETN